MATAILPYSAQHYNSLPSIQDAGRSLTPSELEELPAAVGGIFVRHAVQDRFGLILLHNHFPVEADEMLVSFGNVALPYKTSSPAAELCDIKGSSWRFVDKDLIPYEFVHNSASRPGIQDFQPFLSELRPALERLGLTKKLGICILAPEGQNTTQHIEITRDRMNITLPFDISPDDKSIEAVWGFELDQAAVHSPTPVVLKKCKIACKYGPNTGHCEDHKTTKN
ncbi:hypothetical protein NKR23_g9013 [Pleurostoma richardsiae]|uniref:Uncharacterized protein n=1 Tax=Pleurostoma richardsiae TaxID=41990 RepID=A0AA38R7T0_9PEZI|nr:hypothetical protein NKR23_g9013 [Pleurostoma richardsiae]